MRRTRSFPAVIGLGGMSVLALLSGCAADQSQADTGAGSETGSGSDGPSSDAASGTYTDGTYSATGEYQTPDGTQSVDVEIALADGVVSDVTVSGNATGGNSVRYQGMFESGIAAEAVGVDIDDLSVDRVAGSSLTSDGFNAAVEQIKADALA